MDLVGPVGRWTPGGTKAELLSDHNCWASIKTYRLEAHTAFQPSTHSHKPQSGATVQKYWEDWYLWCWRDPSFVVQHPPAATKTISDLRVGFFFVLCKRQQMFGYCGHLAPGPSRCSGLLGLRPLWGRCHCSSRRSLISKSCFRIGSNCDGRFHQLLQEQEKKSLFWVPGVFPELRLSRLNRKEEVNESKSSLQLDLFPLRNFAVHQICRVLPHCPTADSWRPPAPGVHRSFSVVLHSVTS